MLNLPVKKTGKINPIKIKMYYTLEMFQCVCYIHYNYAGTVISWKLQSGKIISTMQIEYSGVRIINLNGLRLMQ